MTFAQFFATYPELRDDVRQGFDDVRFGDVNVSSWDDSRADLLHGVRTMRDDMDQCDDDEAIAAAWAIGRDLAIARYCRIGSWPDTMRHTFTPDFGRIRRQHDVYRAGSYR